MDAGCVVDAHSQLLVVSCSDSSGPVNPVNSCIFAAVLYFSSVLYFPVFCTMLSCVFSFFMKKGVNVDYAL